MTDRDTFAELKALKALVRQYLKAVEHVPFRALDCDQKLVFDLESQLREAAAARRIRKSGKPA